MKSNNNNNNPCKLINNHRIIKLRRSLHPPPKPKLLLKSLILIQDSVLISMNTLKKKIKRIRFLLDKIGMLLTKTNTKILKRLMMRFTVTLKEWILDLQKMINFYSIPIHKTSIKVQT